MLLELALCILQDISAKSLQLVVAKTTEGGKTVIIDKDESDGDSADAPAQIQSSKIVNAVFRLSDKNGISPDISLSIGKDKDPAYKPPDKQGYFTPVRRSLSREFNKAAQKATNTPPQASSAKSRMGKEARNCAV